MQKVTDSISLSDLKKIATKHLGDFVKAVIDIEQGIMAVDAAMHVDLQVFLLNEGSQQDNLWGILLFPERFGTDEFIVFHSKINHRPVAGNATLGVDNLRIQKQIKELVYRLMTV